MPRTKNLTGKLLNELWDVGAKHALYSIEGKWFHLLIDFPGALFDANGYVVFETYQEYVESPYLNIGQEINISGGISCMPNYVKISEKAQIQHFSQTIKRISEQQKTYKTPQSSTRSKVKIPQGQHDVRRNLVHCERIIRDTKVSSWVKYIHEYKCQFCGDRLKTSHNEYYAEAHHIKPLGNGHNGPDVIENILCVCPNHHALLDLGAIDIDVSKLLNIVGHEINSEYVKYHNLIICKNQDNADF